MRLPYPRSDAEESDVRKSCPVSREYSTAFFVATVVVFCTCAVGFVGSVSDPQRSYTPDDPAIQQLHVRHLNPPAERLAAAGGLQGHHMSNATAGQVFSMNKVRTYVGPRLDPSVKQSSSFPPPDSAKICGQWAVLTSIFEPTDTVRQLGAMPDWCVVVVGDKKGPAEYEVEGATYLSVSQQEALPYRITQQLPWNHFGRKNVGYLYAIHHGAKVIYDVDDDNALILPEVGIPHANTNFVPEETTTFAVGASTIVHNPYTCFGGPNNVWPRGFPLDAVNDLDSTGCNAVIDMAAISTANGEKRAIGVVQSLANHDPDVDAVYRLTHPRGALPFDFSAPHVWDRGSLLTLVPPSTFTPYNAQATLHFEPAFWGMLLPITVHGRVSDIWRSYFTQTLLPASGAVTAFAQPWVEQVRNPHSYLGDFHAEIPLYERSGALVAFLSERRASVAAAAGVISLPKHIETLAVDMYEYGILDEDDVVLTQAWLQDLTDAGYDTMDYGVSTTAGEVVEPTLEEEQKESTLAGNFSPREVQKAQQVPQIEEEDKPSHLLVIAVVSARPDRRQAIRESWLAWGDDRAVVRFFTENAYKGQKGAEATNAALAAESDTHGDMVIMDLDRGLNFSLKLLWAMRWMAARYTFDYFLRLDDDYFLCLKRLLGGLEASRDRLMDEAPLLYGGFRYCRPRATRVDEAYMLLSTELVDRLLSHEDLMCGAHAGLTVGWWFTEGHQANVDRDVRWFFDPRLDHNGVWWKDRKKGAPAAVRNANVCKTHMGIHHTYAKGMRALWSAAKDSPEPLTVNANTVFDYRTDNGCGTVASGVADPIFAQDNAQPCRSFKPAKAGVVHCGSAGC